MLCPHCGVHFKIQRPKSISFVTSNDDEAVTKGREVKGFTCPDCNEAIILLRTGELDYDSNNPFNPYYVDALESETMIYPKSSGADLGKEIPEKYRKDFNEAAMILRISPKASAAICRRMLQEILREEFSISKRDLYQEIEEFISLPNVPSYLADSVDAIRNIGNYAAHPLKSTQTGQIIEVEDGEAEWLLEVLEALFDFAFIQPVRLQERRDKLNDRLRELGKQEMLGRR